MIVSFSCWAEWTTQRTVDPRDLRVVCGNIFKFICREEETFYTFAIRGSYVTDITQ